MTHWCTRKWGNKPVLGAFHISFTRALRSDFRLSGLSHKSRSLRSWPRQAGMGSLIFAEYTAKFIRIIRENRDWHASWYRSEHNRGNLTPDLVKISGQGISRFLLPSPCIAPPSQTPPQESLSCPYQRYVLFKNEVRLATADLVSIAANHQGALLLVIACGQSTSQPSTRLPLAVRARRRQNDSSRTPRQGSLLHLTKTTFGTLTSPSKDPMAVPSRVRLPPDVAYLSVH